METIYLYKLARKGLTPVRIYKTEYLYYIDSWQDGKWENYCQFNYYEHEEFESKCEFIKYHPDFIVVECLEEWMDKVYL